MRVELFYTPGCSSYKKALATLETVIAEERLPLHVEVVKSKRSRKISAGSPAIHVDGRDLLEVDMTVQGEFCRLYKTRQGLGAIPCIEQIRELIWRRWKDLTEAPLLGS